MDSETYIAEGVVPSVLPVMEPMAIRLNDVIEQPDMFGITSEHAYTDRLLDAAADVYSRWFIVMRSAISRERVRQRMQCEDMGVSVDTKLPYERPVLTSAESAIVSLCENMVRSLFDPKVAEYATMKFRKAIDTGDKRSFKIRLLILKSRDSLKGSRLYDGFCDGAEECISKAEKIAGCVPDPSPRRMSKAEKAKAEAKRNRPKQQMLFDCTPYENTASPSLSSPSSAPSDSNIDNIDQKTTRRQVATGKREEPTTLADAGVAAAPVDPDINPKKKASANFDSGSTGAASGVDVASSKDIQPPPTDVESEKHRRRRNAKKNKEIVTVTNVTVTNRDSEPLRKTKVYANVAEISADIESGKICAYESNDEVIGDVKNGKITPAEAVMFLSELSKRKRSDSKSRIGEAVSKDIDIRLGMISDDQAAYKGHMSFDEMEDIDDDMMDDDEEDIPLEDRDDGLENGFGDEMDGNKW